MEMLFNSSVMVSKKLKKRMTKTRKNQKFSKMMQKMLKKSKEMHQTSQLVSIENVAL